MSVERSAIGGQIAKGTFWTVGMRLGIRLLGVASVVILARILEPRDYGIVAQAIMVYAFLEMITAFGLENALIKEKKATRGHYDTVWTLHLLRGLAIAITLCLLALPAAQFFGQPELQAVLYVYAFISLVTGGLNVGIVDFRKQLRFHLDFRFHIYRQLSGFLATIAFAYYFRSYWAFVVGSCVSTLTGVVASFLMSQFRPRLALTEWRSLFDFSKWVLTFELVNALSAKLDTLILGRMSTSAQLGLYTVSQELAGTASTEIAMPVARAMMPGLSTVNDDPVAFRTLYTSSFCMVLMISVPAALGVSALAEPITAVLLGSKWAQAAPIILILAFYGITRVVGAVSSSAFFAAGRVDSMTKLSLATLVFRVVGLGGGYYVGSFWGLVWGALAAGAASAVASLWIQRRTGLLDLRGLVTGSWRVFISASGMWLLLREYPLATGLGTIADLGVGVVIGGALYVGLLGTLWFLSRAPDGPERALVEYLMARLPLIKQRSKSVG